MSQLVSAPTCFVFGSYLLRDVADQGEETEYLAALGGVGYVARVDAAPTAVAARHPSLIRDRFTGQHEGCLANLVGWEWLLKECRTHGVANCNIKGGSGQWPVASLVPKEVAGVVSFSRDLTWGSQRSS